MGPSPCHVRILVVGAAAHDAGVAITKRLELLVELGQFRGADKGEVFGIEKIDDPFARKIGIGKLFDVVFTGTNASLNGKLRERVANREHEKSPECCA